MTDIATPALSSRLDTRRDVVGSWEIVVSDRASAAGQMAMDDQLAQQARPTFRLFRWQVPALSLGFKQPLPGWADRVLLGVHGIELVERPTGGGLAVHGSDLSCSVIVPHHPRLALNALLDLVCESLANGVQNVGVEVEWHPDVESTSRITYCLTQESPYALMAGGRKLMGLAIRRYQASWLIQGSMLVRELPAAFRRVMPPQVYDAFQARAITLEEAAGRAVTDDEIITGVIRAWRMTWDAPCVVSWPVRPCIDAGVLVNGQTGQQANG